MSGTNASEAVRAEQIRKIAGTLLTGIWLITAVVLSRRISGDASALTSEWAACLIGCGILAASCLCVSVPGVIESNVSRSMQLPALGFVLLPGLVLGLTLLPAGSSSGVACLIGLHVLSLVAVVHFDERVGIVGGDSTALFGSGKTAQTCSELLDTSPDRCSDSETECRSAPDNGHSFDGSVFDSAAELPNENSDHDRTQSMVRSVVDGCDVIEGNIQVVIEAGRKLGVAHLPIVPAFSETPEFECEPLDESDVSIRTTAIHSYGIRIEVTRKGDCSEAMNVEIGWFASCPVTQSAAA